MFKNKFKRWLERLSESNEEQFGKGRKLECCDLNKEEHISHTKLTKKTK